MTGISIPILNVGLRLMNKYVMKVKKIKNKMGIRYRHIRTFD